MPLSPEWAKLPKRHCDDCNKLYKPVRPNRPGEKHFCSDNCRKSYHKHGGAYRKLRGEVRKMVDRQMKEFNSQAAIFVRQLVREEIDLLINQSRQINRPAADSIRQLTEPHNGRDVAGEASPLPSSKAASQPRK